MRQRTIGNVLVAFGLSAMILGVVGNKAFAADDLGKYQDKVVSISGSRSYNQGANTTTFSFTLDVSEDVSHLLVMACPATDATDATAPTGVTIEKNQKDGSTDHTGTKFTPGKDGTYTVTFSGDIKGAELVVKNGDGHKHFYVGDGAGCTGQVVTTSATSGTPPSSTEETTPSSTNETTPSSTNETTPSSTEQTTPSSTNETTPSSTEQTTPSSTNETTPSSTNETTPSTGNTGTTGSPDTQGSTTDSSAGTEVLGSQQGNNGGTGPGTEVLAGTETAPDAAIPRTGSSTRTFVEIAGYLLLAGVALLLGGLAVRYGQAD